jgi:hypothetical protein
MEPAKTWAAKYQELKKNDQLVLREVAGAPKEGLFIHTNEIAFDTDFQDGSTIFWTGVRRGDAGMTDGFADDVIVIMNKAKVLFVRLDGSCSIEEIERAFVQICHFTEKDVLWYIIQEPKCSVNWFRPMDYETGEFLYIGRVEERVRTIEKLLKKWLNSTGACEITVHNVFPRKDRLKPATLSIEVLNDQNTRRIAVVHDALGKTECKSITD